MLKYAATGRSPMRLAKTLVFGYNKSIQSERSGYTMSEVIKGKVVYGKQLGRTIGFPTANIDAKEEISCRRGVYFGTCETGGKVYRVILNIGRHPTVPEGAPTIEAHLIDYSGDLYGKEIEVKLLRFMRPETKFDSLDALKDQLTRDMQSARLYEIE